MVEFHRIVGFVAAVIANKVTALRIAEIDVAISKFDREILRYFVGKAGMKRPGEAPLACGICISVTQKLNGDITEAADRIAAHANTGADEGRNVVPSAEIDIGICREPPCRLAGGVVVVERLGANVADAKPVEISTRTVFASDVETQPLVEIV